MQRKQTLNRPELKFPWDLLNLSWPLSIRLTAKYRLADLKVLQVKLVQESGVSYLNATAVSVCQQQSGHLTILSAYQTIRPILNTFIKERKAR